MAGNFGALDELLDESIELPVPSVSHPDRKTYRIESPGAKDGLFIQRLTTAAVQLVEGGENIDTEALDDGEERELFQRLLGATFAEMVEDGVKWVWMRHAALTVLMWVSSGMETAEKFWAAAGNPEALAPNREARRSKQKDGSAAATSTPRRGSTNGTNRNRGTKGHRHPATQK